MGKKQEKDYEEQIEKLLSQMTLEEKVGMVHGNGIFRSKGVERLGIPDVVYSDGPMGVRMQFQNDYWYPACNTDDYVNYNPSNSALAATWNTELAYKSGKILGEEARGRGKDVILAPGINIKRDPLCGRNFEYMSEEPALVKALVVPMIEGIQESDVAACVKHFAVNNQETDRLAIDTYVDERTLREIYLPGFEAAVKEANTYALMNAYNKFRGSFCSESKELLDAILREEWNYDGAVISDWGSVHSTKGVAECSMDVEMDIRSNYEDYYLANPLLEMIRSGEVSESCVDAKVRNILRMMFRIKMLGEEACDRQPGAYNTKEHQQGVYEVARESIVLLKNEGHLLPLTKEQLSLRVVCDEFGKVTSAKKVKIAIIGANADTCHASGGGSAEIKALYEISPLMGLKKVLGGNTEITYAKGYYVPPRQAVTALNWQEASLERHVMEQVDENGEEQKALRKEIEQKRQELLQEACEVAKAADIVIFVGGLDHDYDTEGRDRASMELPYAQDAVIEKLLEINSDTIVVIHAGSPVEMPWREKAKAIVWSYFAGMETGTAIADVLLGKINPSAKLPESFPGVYTDTVTYKNGEFGNEGRVEYKEGLFYGYRYYEKEGIQPAFAFGHGLSYTEFAITNPSAVKEEDGDVVVKVDVENTGEMAGAEVVQCYVTDCECSVERPVKELKAFRKVFLKPGEKQQISMKLTSKDFAFYDVEKRAFVTEPGEFVLHIGNASNSCDLQVNLTI